MNKYNKEFFTPADLEDAKRLILLNHEFDYKDRWDVETSYTMDIIGLSNTFDENSYVLDWGTGIGRMAKPLIEKYNCKVLGVDINDKMLSYAKEYVNSDNFTTMTVDEFKKNNFQNTFTHALALWVLQHSPTSQYDISFLTRSLVPTGKLLVHETHYKCIPKVVEGDEQPWYADDINNKGELERWYEPLMLGNFPDKLFPESITKMSYWGFLKRINYNGTK